MPDTSRQLLRFCLAGCLGFLVDCSVLYLAAGPLRMGPYGGRIVSYLAAATVTWRLNRRYTFAAPARARPAYTEWLAYLYANALGGTANYLTYLLCIDNTGLARRHLVIGVAAGSIVGLACNFSASKWWVFARR